MSKSAVTMIFGALVSPFPASTDPCGLDDGLDDPEDDIDYPQDDCCSRDGSGAVGSLRGRAAQVGPRH